MRHVALTTIAAFTAVVAIVACEEQAPDKSLTAPDAVSFARPIGGACDAGRARLIETQQADLWARPALDQAKALFATVASNCSAVAGKSLMLDYIQWTIDNRGARRTGTTDAQLLAHWNTVFPYVGYTGNDQPTAVPSTIFSTGAVGVIDGDEQGEISVPNAAALTSYVQDANGDARDHLFVIYPITANCLTGTNLRQFGPCFQFSAFPHVAPNFSPKVKVGICQPLHLGENFPLAKPSLGHLDPVTRITEEAGTYPAFCDDVTATVPAGAWNQGLGNMMTRLAWYAKRVVTPKPLYAVHGGLGGLGAGLSPFGAVDLEVFSETFSSNAVGTVPDSLAETGKWKPITVKAPGSIIVQGSLGDVDNKLAVLNQAGGNCSNSCGGLLLQGNLFTEGNEASAGIYDAEWVSLQAQSNMKEAVFVLRDLNGRDIARLTYAVRNNQNVILYNDIPGTRKQPGTIGKTVGTWTQNKKDHFRIRVVLDGTTLLPRNTTLYFNGATTTALSNLPFVNTGATGLSIIAADFSGIDSGTIGWDDIKVVRLPDLNH